jgi:CrcB protein
VRDILFVALGGAAGSVLRYGAGLAAARLLGRGFPWGTLAVNIAGCLAIGIVSEYLLGLESHAAQSPSPALKLQIDLWRKGVAIGLLGGLTTFSTFGADTLRELESGRPLTALANVAANVVLSLAAAGAGMALVRAVD